MPWSIVATQDESSFREDYYRLALAEEPTPLPEKVQTIGPVTASWFQTTPGVAHIDVRGGNIEDRLFARRLVGVQLEGHGFKQAVYHLDWDLNDKQLIKEASWQDIEAKAKRLIQSGKVQILRNGAEVIVGQVEGDHGTYQTEIDRNDPTSQAIALWQCECKWDQFAWQRTRKWKKYEGRVCAHVLATYWLAQTMPLDEDINPAGTSSPSSPSPFGQGQMSLPLDQQGQVIPGTGMMPAMGVGPGGPVEGQPGAMQGAAGNASQMVPPMVQPGQQMQMQFPPPGQAPPPDIMPQYPMDPSLFPAVNPVSVPGQKPQTPMNPVQNAGGTFSSVKTSDEQFINGEKVRIKKDEIGTTVGLNSGQSITIPAGSIGEVRGEAGGAMVEVYVDNVAAQNGQLEPHGATAWFMKGELTKVPGAQGPGPRRRR